MSTRTNRRDQILAAAAELFMRQGYAATSVRQIAEAVGCTEAALYYHFKDGKRELLRAVVADNIPDLIRAVERCQEAATLREFVRCFARQLAAKAHRDMTDKLRWIAAEFPKLSDEERGMLYEKHHRFRVALCEVFRRFTASEADAQQLTWMMMFIMFGYGHLMITLDMISHVDFDLETFLDNMATALSAFAERSDT
jgi:AcrR family transcriptional regulator